MPRFEPFAGLRYRAALAPADDLIAPPYDIVSPEERERLAARSPWNAIHLELPVPDEAAGLDRYRHAAALLEAWLAEDAVRRELASAFYVYRMVFSDDRGRPRSTTGVIGALGLDPQHSGQVLPHERTMPKPKGDRLELLRATRTNLSPIWGLSLSDGLAAAAAAAVEGLEPAMSALDDEGVRHQLWAVEDPAALEQIVTLVAATPVVVADGHHRYETACFYQAERQTAHGDERQAAHGDERQAGHGADTEAAYGAETEAAPGDYDLVMGLIVELSEDELLVRAIHRLIAGLPDGFDLVEALRPWFDVEEVPDGSGELSEAMHAKGGLGLVSPGGCFLLVPRPEVEEAAEADLDSSRLDVALADLPAHELSYQHGTDLAVAAVTAGLAQAAVLLRPATVAQIADTAHSGRRMPPKTTYFYPKPRTGMVLRRVED